jgi:hypothetical protein
MVDGKNWRKLYTVIFPYTYTGVAIHPDTFTLADSTQKLSDLNLVCLSYSIRNPAAWQWHLAALHSRGSRQSSDRAWHW